MAANQYSEAFEKIFSLIRYLSNIFGADVIQSNYRINWRTVFAFVLVNVAIGFTFYSVYVEMVVYENVYILIQSSAVLGSAIQAYAKLVNGVYQHQNFRFLYIEIKDIYLTYEQKTPSYSKTLKTNISLVKKLLITLFTIIMLTSLIISALPVVLFLIYNERYEVLPFKFPFIDYETEFGYYFTSGIHVISVFFGLFGNFVNDSWLFIYAAQIPLMKNIMKCKLKDLDSTSEKHPKDFEKLKVPLMDIFKWHQKYNIYCATINNTYFWVVFVQISTLFVSIICNIVCVLLGIWPPALALLIYLLSMTYSYCALGNLVELSNDDITIMIYDCCWYNLTVPEQKMVLIMLRESQRATSMSIGGVAPLSLNTALQLTKTIYTLSMMLNEFLN